MKNPRSEERGFLAPPAGLAQEKAAGGRFLQAVSATRTGAKRNQRQPELTLPPCGSGVFSCPLDVGIPQAEPKATRQFRLRQSCLSRMVGAGAGSNQATRFASLNREFAGRLDAVLLQAEPQSSRLCLALRAHRRLARMLGHSGKGSQQKSPRRLPRAFCWLPLLGSNQRQPD